MEKAYFVDLLDDRAYIESKFHGEDFVPIDRFKARTYGYDESTGLTHEELYRRLGELSSRLEGEPREIHKARLVEFVLDNTRIDVSPNDYFVDIATRTRPLYDLVIKKWHGEAWSEVLGDDISVHNHLNSTGTSWIWMDFDHTVPRFDRMLELGFRGIIDELDASYARHLAAGTLDTDMENFYNGAKIEYEAIIRFIDRLYNYTLTRSFPKAKRIAKCLKSLRDGAPRDTYEVLEMMYLYFMISEHIDNYQVRSLGLGLDHTLTPYVRRDLKEGRYTEEEIHDFIGYFLMQFSAIGNYWGQPMYLGGTYLDGSTVVNEVSYMILDIYDRLGLYNPKVQIKHDPTTPKEFILRVLEIIRGGNSSFVFVNEQTAIKALMSNGANYADARRFIISGCYEYKTLEGIGISSIYYNAVKPLELVFENGRDKRTGRLIGLTTGEITEFDTFEKFYAAYLAQFKNIVDVSADIVSRAERVVHKVNPSLLYSATTESCTSKLRDALNDGVGNSTATLINGLGSAVDGLMAVYELVFEKKVTTLEELKRAVDADWQGYERLQRLAKRCKHRYGVNDGLADFYANAIHTYYAALAHSKINRSGKRHEYELHSARTFIEHGKVTMATPDGRRAGEELSKNITPAIGSDTKGVTAMINSATSLDLALCDIGGCLDVMLHPSAIEGEDGLEAFYALLDTYMKQGGASAHFNVFNADTLRDAQKHPEAYTNLQVRVCGWNVLWNNLCKAEQDAYIARAESIG